MDSAEIHILYNKFDDRLEENQFDKYLNQLPEKSQKHICQFRSWRDAQASLLSKILLQEGLIRYCHLGKNILDSLEYSWYHRPVLNDVKDIDFNISHSEQFVICAIGTNVKVGIDVEWVRPIPLDDFENQFSCQEFVSIHNSENKYLKFFSYWTKKEAVLKAEGTGLAIPLQQISLNMEENIATVFTRKWFISDLDIDKEYIVSLAMNKPLKTDSVIIESVSL